MMAMMFETNVRGIASRPCRQPNSRAVQQKRTAKRCATPARLTHSKVCNSGDPGGGGTSPARSSSNCSAISATST
ncbi:MAG TPA: hypothetical protein DIW45_06515 [Erythrobacter sp.]|nr:hypothetical protein [Erythrobacter sp.]